MTGVQQSPPFSISTGWFKTVNLTPSITISKRRRQCNSLLNIAPSTKWIKTVRQTLSFAVSTRWKQCTRPSVLPSVQDELRQCISPLSLPSAQDELRQYTRSSVLPSAQDEDSTPDPQYCHQHKMKTVHQILSIAISTRWRPSVLPWGLHPRLGALRM